MLHGSQRLEVSVVCKSHSIYASMFVFILFTDLYLYCVVQLSLTYHPDCR